MFAVNYGDKVAEPLLKECGHSQVLLEQYLDFVVNRTFRQTLLVHAERAPQIRYALDRARYERMHFAAYVPPVDDEVLLDNSTQEFGAPGQTLSTGVPDVKVAMEVLTNRWPWTLSRRELVGRGASAPQRSRCRIGRQRGDGHRRPAGISDRERAGAIPARSGGSGADVDATAAG